MRKKYNKRKVSNRVKEMKARIVKRVLADITNEANALYYYNEALAAAKDLDSPKVKEMCEKCLAYTTDQRMITAARGLLKVSDNPEALKGMADFLSL